MSESYEKVEYLEEVTRSVAFLGEAKAKLNTHIEGMYALFAQEHEHLKVMQKTIAELE
jgi:predicted metal-dependent hydrolase